MRVALAGVAAAVALLAAPGVASADVIFDPADAEDLAEVLADATAEQDVCYGWDVQVSDPVAGSDASVGSNFGVGRSVNRSVCDKMVQFPRTRS
ncbi:MAG: hypothetical protein LC635_05370 [Pseudonocardiaceae bacterium]|nr:hypothetical protein [Pseudonocardiaceae bacterium]